MADFVINTSSINAYGTRVLTTGINTTQFEKNPVLLYMHERGYNYGGDPHMPIGRVENIRKDGDRLIGTPVFDMEDEFAAKIANKWDNNFLRMCSAGIEPIEYSTSPEQVKQGQTRATITKSILIEVSIVDIGANNDALRLYQPGGKLLRLTAGEECDFIPLLKTDTPIDTPVVGVNKEESNNNQNTLKMNLILLALGLPEAATEKDALEAITKLQAEAKKAETIELARITDAVDAAIAANKTTADKREHLITLGTTTGFESLQVTLGLLNPVLKPNDVINHASGTGTPAAQKYSELSGEQLKELRANNHSQYAKLYKAEFGIEPAKVSATEK